MSSRLRAWFHNVRATDDARPVCHRSDAALVTAFAESRDDEAFAELVRRHGPMVLTTCRRVLHPDSHSADDAFQAAFLVLATKAGAVSPPGASRGVVARRRGARREEGSRLGP